MILQLPIDDLAGWLLASLRVGIVLYMLPTLGGDVLATLPRVILAFLLGLLLAPTASLPDDFSTSGLLSASVREATIGATLGFSCRFVLFAPLLAGDLIAQDLGLRLAQEVDPTTRIPSTAVGRLYEVVLLMVFLAIRGHHDVLRALHLSFSTMPVGGSVIPNGLAAMTESLGMLLRYALLLAAPMMVTMFLGSMMLALLAKSVPQLQVLSFGYPLRMLGVLLMASFALSLVLRPSLEMFASLRRLLHALVTV